MIGTLPLQSFMFAGILLGFLVCIVCCEADCQYVIAPKTVVALLGQNVTISCYNHGMLPKMRINSDIVVSNSIQDIHWMVMIMNENISGLEINITATTDTNYTSFQCIISCASETVRIIVVESPPNAPDAPDALLLSPTVMQVTWSPPWPHPINSYIIYINNTYNGVLMQRNTTNTILMIDKEFNVSCYELELSVLANTDVGPSPPSAGRIKGFPKDILDVNISELEVSIEFQIGRIFIYLGILDVCVYEELLYNYYITHRGTNNTNMTSTTNRNVTILLTDDFIKNGDTIDVSVVVINEGNQNRTITLFTNKTVEIDMPHYTRESDGLASSSPIVSVSPSFDSGSIAINTVEIILIVAIGGFLLFVVLVIVAVTPLLYLLLCTKPNKKAIEDRNFVLPQNMISNDHYVMTDDTGDHIYEVIKPQEHHHSEKTESSLLNKKESNNLSKMAKFNDYRLQEDTEYVEMSALSNNMPEDDNRLQYS